MPRRKSCNTPQVCPFMNRGAISLGFALVASIPASAAEERPPADFVDATALVPALRTDMRYAGAHNFTGVPVAGYEAPRCLLTREAAEALACVQADLAGRGLGLLVYDCYRPVRAVRRFAEWAKVPDETSCKREFYPDVNKSDLFRLGYIAERSSHSRGSTVDLTLVDAKTGRPLDMGTPFDLFGPASHPDAAGLSATVAANRKRLAATMQRHGFKPYDQEWWHFTLADEPYPNTYFDAPIR